MNYLEINQAQAFFSGSFFELAFGIAADYVLFLEMKWER